MNALPIDTAPKTTITSQKTLFSIGCLLIIFVPISTAISNYLIAIYLIIYALTIHNNRKAIIESFKHPVAYCIFAIIIYSALSSLLTPNTMIEKAISLKYSARLLLIPLLSIAFVTNKQKNAVLNLFISSVIASLIVVYLKMSSMIPSDMFSPGITQGFKDSIFSSLLAALAMFFCLIKQDTSKNSPHKRLIYIVTSMLLFHYLYFISIGRTGQIIGIILLIYSLYYTFNKTKLLFLAISTSIVLSLFFVNNLFKDRLIIAADEIVNFHNDNSNSSNKEILARSTSSSGLRLEWARHSFQLFLEKPILGWGLGNFSNIYQKQFPKRQTVYGSTVSNPHNQYLYIAVETGIVGLILHLILLINIMKWCSILDYNNRLILKGFLIAIVIGCLANSWLKDSTSSMLIVSIVAIFSTKKQHFQQ